MTFAVDDKERAAIGALLEFPLVAAINGRRSRRFPVGGEVSAGELARLSILGASGNPDVPGLGFHVQHDDRWSLPNPTGLPGVFETLSRPHVPDAEGAVQLFAERKFGAGGPFDPTTPGPWRDTAAVRGSAAPYDDRFIRLLTDEVRYIDETFGKLPGTVPTVHILNYLEGAYLPTHRDHQATWH